MSFTLNLPVNSVSFGQVSTLLLRELYKKNLNDFTLYPIGDRYDLSTQESDEGFLNFLQARTADFVSKIKHWHIITEKRDKQLLSNYISLKI